MLPDAGPAQERGAESHRREQPGHQYGGGSHQLARHRHPAEHRPGEPEGEQTGEADAEVEILYEHLRDAVRARRVDPEVLDLLEHTPFGERRRAFARSLSKGKRVWVISFEREGVVTRINKEKEKLTVRVGEVAVDTDFDDVSWIK